MLNDEAMTPLPSDVQGDDALLADIARNEVLRASQHGHDVTTLVARLDAASAASDPVAELEEILDTAQRLDAGPAAAHEPSGLDAIRRSLVPSRVRQVDSASFGSRLEGAWTGRIVGNMLGKPVENGTLWTKERIGRYLATVGLSELTDYVPVSPEDAQRWGFLPNWPQTTRGRVSGSSRDDDIDYTILNLHVLETCGPEFTTSDIARTWLELLPYRQTYTAERAVYRSLVLGAPPATVGEVRNPYREWIGALIRADVFGMVRPGDPRAAAELAWRDARLSHRANGIYGAMWAAALVSTALVSDDVTDVVRTSLDHVPPRSALALEVGEVVAMHAAGTSWSDTVDAVLERHEGRSWVHVLPNVGVITAALLWGEGSFTRSIDLAVRSGLDTDSSAATVGAVVGALVGAGGIDPVWTEPLGGKVRSAVFGNDGTALDALVARTLALVTSGGSDTLEERGAGRPGATGHGSHH